MHDNEGLGVRGGGVVVYLYCWIVDLVSVSGGSLCEFCYLNPHSSLTGAVLSLQNAPQP